MTSEPAPSAIRRARKPNEGRKMRLLCLSSTLPLPANNGLRLRLRLLLRALAEFGHEVHLIALADPSEPAGGSPELDALCESWQAFPLEKESRKPAAGYGRRLLSLGSPLPYAARRLVCEPARAQIGVLLRRKPVDAILAHTVFPLVNLPETNAPLVIDSPDVEHILFQRYETLSRNPLARLYARWEARRTGCWEKRAYDRASFGMACSEHDRAQLKALSPGTEIFLVPNAVDLGPLPQTALELPRRVLFTGALDWLPNRDAVRLFIENILPQIAAQIPDVEFVVAGRNAPESFRRRFEKPPGVRFTGTIPDIRPELERALVCVAPLRIGSGTRLKILEAAAMAKPVVSTTLGAEGLELAKDTEILIGDDPAQFAEAVIGLIRNPERRRAIGQAARVVVQKKYSFAAFCRSLAAALDCPISSKPAFVSGQTSQQSGNFVYSVAGRNSGR